MSLYKYRAVDEEGLLRLGFQEATSKTDLEEKLEQQGKTVLLAYRSYLTPKASMSDQEVIDLFIHLYHLEKAGVPLLDALKDAYQLNKNISLKAILKTIYEDVKQGTLLSQAFSKHPAFQKIIPSLISLSEETGQFEQAFQSIYEHLQWLQTTKKDFIKAIRYPLFLLFIFGGVFTFMMTMVVPQLQEFLVTLGHTESSSFDAISGYFSLAGYSIALLVVCLIAFALLSKLSLIVQSSWDRFKFLIPFYRSFLLSRFFQFFSVSLSAGLDILKALELSSGAIHNYYFQTLSKGILQETRAGIQLSTSFERTGLFPDHVIRMLQVGEVTGQLPSLMETVRLHFEDKTKHDFQSLIAALEPTFILALGGFLLWIIFSVFYPLYDQLGGLAL